jgi:hypothetical protein
LEQSVFSVHTECSRFNTLRERGRARERDSGPARPRRHQPAGPFQRQPAKTPALHQDNHTNTAGETRTASAPGATKTLREPQPRVYTLEAQQIGLLQPCSAGGVYTGRAGVPHLTAWTVRAALCSAATAAAPTLAGLGFRTPTQLMMIDGFYSTVEVCPKFPGQRFAQSKSEMDSVTIVTISRKSTQAQIAVNHE